MITLVLIIIAGVSIYFLLKPPVETKFEYSYSLGPEVSGSAAKNSQICEDTALL